jgi:superfamily I DNA/RNA helicase/RecB family exonuclease
MKGPCNSYLRGPFTFVTALFLGRSVSAADGWVYPVSPTYRLLRPRAEALTPPVLDDDQRRVVGHRGGPLLVLAGPGTGKTTTLVEAIVERIEGRGADPESVLALTFSRKAAEQLRDRVTARLGRTTSSTLCATFHSFAYGLVRRYSPPDLYVDPLRLLSAPEQDVVVRGLLTREDESVAWPAGLAGALETRGFARELGDLMARTTERGLGSRRLRELGLAESRPELVAAADFMDQYDAVLGSQNALDYPSLIADAVAMLQDPDHPARADLRAQYSHVFVDEYQDTDPSQLALLQAVAGDGRNLTVVGDPLQSIYGFRGADVRGILQFPTMFPRRDEGRADVVVLRTTRRFGPRLLEASRRVAGRIGLPGTIGEAEQRAFLDPVAAGEHGDGRAQVLTFDTARAETEALADLLRRAHLEDGIGWSDMAVLVRSGRTTIPGLRRALMAAGVPVEVSSDETPLVREPAVLPLLDALHAVADPHGWLDAERAHGLLVSPLAGLDATDVRALARALRRRDQQGDEPARSSPELLLAALRDPDELDELDLAAARRARAVARLLGDARSRLDDGGTVEEVLWELWAGTTWPGRLRRLAERGGAAARYAHRDLDAVCALFETAARAEEQRGHTSVETFLETLRAQQIPADTLADRGVRGDAVRLLTAHRAKGLEWRLVAVFHAQEEAWPDLRRRASLLRADEIGHDGLQTRVTTRELLAEERRLFYVACTRARERLLVTAVASPDDDGEQPSRFLAELGLDVEHRQGRPPRPLSLDGLVADLRRTVADETAPEPLRLAAARRLACLKAEEVDGRPLVPAADPATWWGTRAPSAGDVPVRPADQPLRITASALTAIGECPARWFLEREAGGERASTQSQGFGKVVHALADRISRGDLGGADDAGEVVEELMTHIDRVWQEIPFRTPWSAPHEREEARAALTRFLAWHRRPGARTVLGTEQEVRASVTLPDGSEVSLHGYADRLEIDDEGRVVVIDLKTTKYPPQDGEIATNAQLGLYQLAVEQGAVDQVLGRPGVPGGAELWQLRKDVRGALKVQRQDSLEPGPERPIEQQLGEAAEIIRSEVFPTRPGQQCERCDFRLMCPAQSSHTVLS